MSREGRLILTKINHKGKVPVINDIFDCSDIRLFEFLAFWRINLRLEDAAFKMHTVENVCVIVVEGLDDDRWCPQYEILKALTQSLIVLGFPLRRVRKTLFYEEILKTRVDHVLSSEQS